LEILHEDLIQTGLKIMVVGLSIVTRCIRPFVCVVIFSEIIMRDKLGVMHLELMVGTVGTRKVGWIPTRVKVMLIAFIM